MELTAERLREVLGYDPETGVFTRRLATTCRVKAGGTVGCLRRDGYLTTSIDSKLYLLHRLAWLGYITPGPGQQRQ